LYKGKIINEDQVDAFKMPSLEDKQVSSEEDIFKKAEEIQRRAYEEGYKAGEKAGRAEGERQAEILVEKIGNILSELVEFQREFVNSMEKQVVELSIAIARRILRDEISTRPELIVSIVKEALKRLQKSGKIIIRMNPSVHEIFLKKKQELAEIHDYIEFEVNPNTPLTGPVVISEIEEVVTDLDSLIENIKKELADVSNDRS